MILRRAFLAIQLTHNYTGFSKFIGYNLVAYYIKSYQYFIELLIAGAGSVVWIILFAIDVFGIEWFEFEYNVLQNMSDGILFALIIMLFPFLFVNGIITDRVSDYIFDKTANIKIS